MTSTLNVRDLNEIRAREPHRIAQSWAGRTKRQLLGADGRLLIVAADHPARGALGVRSDANAMASRTDLLERLATALSRPGVDGVLVGVGALEPAGRQISSPGRITVEWVASFAVSSARVPTPAA